MKAAVPIFNNDVAPRFGFTDRFLIADIDDDKVVHCNEINIENRGWAHRLERIRNLGIDTLLCGGFNRHYIPLSETLGIRVITGLSGTGLEVLEKFAQGELALKGDGPACDGRGQGRGNGRGGSGGGRGGRGRGKGRCRQPSEPL